jgi:hypothetical protein
MARAFDSESDEAARQAYFRRGQDRALALDNRGPLRLTAEGKLDPHIVQAYNHFGFYVFEGLIEPGELAELEADYLDMYGRLPSEPGSPVDHLGRPALGADLERPAVYWAKPLSDPAGGTDVAQGRHPVKMFEPEPAAGLPDKIVTTIAGSLHHSDAMLRLYGTPGLLSAAASVLGDDFTPFQEGIIIKRPGEGRSFAWHQDGTTHWTARRRNQHSHGLNFMPQLYRSTSANGVWFVPGSQASGRADIRALVEQAGGQLLPDAVPLVCAPGDVAMSNRQIIHGSFPNTSPDPRVTLNFGFLPRRSVIGVTGYPFGPTPAVTYTAQWIRRRAEVIGYAIDARRRHFPDEAPYVYQPHADAGAVFAWNEEAREAIRNYNCFDIRI